MAWLRVSDSAGNNPIVLAPLLTDPAELPPMDSFLWTNTIFGVVTRCATNAACYGRSYYVEDATIASYVGPQWRVVAEAAQKAGYWRPTDRGWLLVDDSEHLLHIRKGEEIDWEKARKADAANDKLTVPVRLRDGDGCRYCPKLVIWRDNVSKRGGTYDHRVPGQQARTPDDLRVACRGCNGERGDDPNADERMPPRPVPATPFYGPKTVEFLRERGFTVLESAPQRPGSLPDTARRDPAESLELNDLEVSSGTTRTSDPTASRTTLPGDPAPGGTTPAHAQITVDALAGSANRRATEVHSPGRDGTDTGRAGSGRNGSGSRRARRGKGKRS